MMTGSIYDDDLSMVSLGENMTRKAAGPNVLPTVLSKALQPYTEPGGASPFTVALTEATPQHVGRVEELAGPLGQELCITLYSKTQNPIWLWASIAGLKTQAETPLEAFQYLEAAGRKVLDAIVKQTCSLETVRITPGMEVEEAIVRQPKAGPPPLDILEILGLSHPGRNLIKAAAGDIRDLSFANAVENQVRKTGCSRDAAYTALAKSNGRTSAETGPSTASIKQIATRGRKLMASRTTTKRK